MLSTAIEILTAAMTLAALCYALISLIAARSFLRLAHRAYSSFHAPVSILKPVKGVDPEMYQAFASHCAQQFAGEYELIFGVGSLDDPAVPLIRRLQAEFPQRAISLVDCPQTLGLNRKVSTLVQMLPHAQYAHILINDSDIRVGPEYLKCIMAKFLRDSVGMVTTPYRGRAHGGIWSHIEALGISTEFMPGVLTALKLEHGIRFALGSTLAISRRALNDIGGLEPLLNSLADDYEMGLRTTRAGYEVALAHEVVETSVPAYTFKAFLAHQLRWARTVRDARRSGYMGLVFTYGIPWALLNVVASGAAMWSIALLSVTVAARVAQALAIGVGVIGDTQVLRNLWLLPIRDMYAMILWICGYAGDTVVWRGEKFTLSDGRLNPHGAQ
jgi:ceramide glucosyltransferase